MNVEQSTGVILRLHPLTDTSLIVQWLTPELGRLATVAKGARRPKSPFRGQLDLFYSARFSFVRSRRSELHTLREVQALDLRAALRRDLGCVRQISYAAGLIEQATEPESPLPELYEQFTAALDEWPRHAAQVQTLFAFEMKLLEISGLRPDLSQSALTPGSRQILERLVGLDWPGVFRLRLSAGQVVEIGRFLESFLTFHLGKVPRGRAAALGAE